MEETVYYKAITSNHGMLYSWSACCEHRVCYSTEEYVSAPKALADLGYHLLVFSDLRCAIRFLKCNTEPDYRSWAKLFRCAVKGIVEDMPPMLWEPGTTTKLWGNGAWPISTVMVEEVMLLEEIEW